MPEQKLIPASFRGKKFYMSKQSKSKIVSGSIISITVAGETFSVVPAAKTGRKLEGFENKLNR
ncbi:hypothetical protein KAR91_46995 [Candidatus Pacearchaeota archaeon]|nr:hypothetical protein [Candidatus Pacearchaeota archaeon]